MTVVDDLEQLRERMMADTGYAPPHLVVTQRQHDRMERIARTFARAYRALVVGGRPLYYCRRCGIFAPPAHRAACPSCRGRLERAGPRRMAFGRMMCSLVYPNRLSTTTVSTAP